MADETNIIDTATNAIVTAFSHPTTGVSISTSAYLLNIAGYITPWLTIITVVVGLIAATFSMFYKYHHWKLEELNVREKEIKLNELMAKMKEANNQQRGKDSEND